MNSVKYYSTSISREMLLVLSGKQPQTALQLYPEEMDVLISDKAHLSNFCFLLSLCQLKTHKNLWH